MRTTKLTPEIIAYIHAHYQTTTGTDIARMFGLRSEIVTIYMRKNNIQSPKSISAAARIKGSTGHTTSTPEIDKIIRKKYLKLPLKPLAKSINKSTCFLLKRMEQLNLTIPSQLREQRKTDSRIKPGSIPHNKGKKMTTEVYKKCSATMFPKGNIPKNHKPVGFERIDPDGYIYIKIAEPRTFVLKHRLEWEQRNGPIPPNHNITFKDGDKHNTEISNLRMLSNEELMNINSIRRYPQEIQDMYHIYAALTRTINSLKNE